MSIGGPWDLSSRKTLLTQLHAVLEHLRATHSTSPSCSAKSRRNYFLPSALEHHEILKINKDRPKFMDHAWSVAA
jgi:hypothetical protein